MTTLAKVSKIIAQHLHIEEVLRVDPKNTVFELGGDSLGSIEIAMELEDEFDIEVSDDDAAHMSDMTVERIAKLVDELVAAQHP